MRIMARLETRLDAALNRLTRQYAPQAAALPQSPADRAAALAGHNLLVMIGAPPAADVEAAVNRWVESYVNLYDLLTRRLFPSFTRIKAFYADAEQPPIVVVQGAATPVLVVLARYVTPYVAARQLDSPSDLELFGLTDLLLEALEAGDLPRDEYRNLRDDGAAQLRRILAAPVRQRALTAPHPQLAATFASIPLDGFMPDPAAPAAPTSLPETPTDSPFGPSIPVFFERRARGKRPPPVPKLPK